MVGVVGRPVFGFGLATGQHARFVVLVIDTQLERWCLIERGRIKETTCPWVICGGRGLRKRYM